MVFARGVGPVLADGATYLAIVALGHAVMWLVAGPAPAGTRPRDVGKAA
jgi:hypothetical protein